MQNTVVQDTGGPSDDIDCLKPASRIWGCCALVFYWKMLWFIRLFAVQLQSKPWKFKPHNSLVFVMSPTLAYYHGMLNSANGSDCYVNMCTGVLVSESPNRLPSESPIFLTTSIRKNKKTTIFCPRKSIYTMFLVRWVSYRSPFVRKKT